MSLEHIILASAVEQIYEPVFETVRHHSRADREVTEGVRSMKDEQAPGFQHPVDFPELNIGVIQMFDDHVSGYQIEVAACERKLSDAPAHSLGYGLVSLQRT